MPDIHKLTARQKLVARLACEAYTNEELAKILGMHIRTLKRHLGQIYFILEVDGRVALVRDLLLPLDSPLRKEAY